MQAYVRIGGCYCRMNTGQTSEVELKLCNISPYMYSSLSFPSTTLHGRSTLLSIPPPILPMTKLLQEEVSLSQSSTWNRVLGAVHCTVSTMGKLVLYCVFIHVLNDKTLARNVCRTRKGSMVSTEEE